MDFFEEQVLARKRTRRLALLFTLAVLGVIASVYALAMLVSGFVSIDAAGVRYMTGDYENIAQLALAFWDPGVFLFALGSTAAVVGLGSLYKVAQLRAGGPAVALGLGGRRVDPDSTRLDERRLLNVVEEMAIASGIPAPEVYVLDREPGINAFAAGNTTSDAVIGVTQGTLQLLRRDELQGVIAHEFSHILNGDSRINLRAIGLLHGIFLLALIGRFLIRGSMHSGKKEGGGVAVIGIGLLAIGSIGVFFGRMIQSSISRQRELLADASAVQFTRDTDGLVGALKKIGGASSSSHLQTPKADEASHIFFSDAIRRLRLFAGLFRTHPPLGERIRKLEPSWDGEFPEVAVPRIAQGMSTPPGPLGAEVYAFSEAPTELSVGQSLEHIGSPRPEQVAFARSLHAALPELWIHAVHQAPMAQAMVFGLLLAQDEVLRGTELIRLEELTDPPTADLTLRFHSEAVGRSSAEKIALVDMALPTLRNLSVDEYERFRHVVDALMQSDRRIDLFEYTLSRVRVHAEPDDPASPRASLRGCGPGASEVPVASRARARLARADRHPGSSWKPNRGRSRARVSARRADASSRGRRRSHPDRERMHPCCGRSSAQPIRCRGALAQEGAHVGLCRHGHGRRQGHRPRGGAHPRHRRRA